MISLCPRVAVTLVTTWAPAAIGQTFRCLKCDAAAEVEGRATSRSSPPSGEGPTCGPLRHPLQRGRRGSPMSSIVREGNSGGGVPWACSPPASSPSAALLVILFLFLPIIDQAYVSRLGRPHRLGERPRAPHRRGPAPSSANGCATRSPIPTSKGRATRHWREQEESDDRKKDREKWDKRRRCSRTKSRTRAERAARQATSASIGMLVGLLTLAVRAIAFLAASQSTPRRSSAYIVITVQMVVIFMLCT